LLLTLLRFLLAYIYISALQDNLTAKEVKNTLSRFQKTSRKPSGNQTVSVLDRAYEEAMERIDRQIPGHRALAMRVLAWITCAKRRLKAPELQHALSVEIGASELDEDNLPEIHDIISVCAGLVTIDEESSVIRLVHYTTQEFFERTQSKWFPNAEDDIGAVCVTYLSFSTFTHGPCLTDNKFQERLQIYQFYDYAAQNWGYHARKASELCKEVLRFLGCQTQIAASAQALVMTWERPLGYTTYRIADLLMVNALHLIAYFGIDKAIQQLLDKGAAVEIKDTSGRTPLSWAAERGHEAVVQQLLDNGAAIETTDNLGQTPLSLAAECGHEAVIQQLLDNGAAIETMDNLGRTPLSWAAWHGHRAVVQQLLDNGAAIETMDILG
jgi:hypothetical protein